MRALFRTSLGVFFCSLALAACNEAAPERVASVGEPTFYRSLAAKDAAVDAQAARDMISLYRRNNGLAPVSLDPRLRQAAQAQADAMAQANSLDHNIRGELRTRLDAAGLGSASGVENVSAGYHTLAEAFSGWRQSAPHNRNLLERRAARMGIATAYAPGTKYKVFWALIMTD